MAIDRGISPGSLSERLRKALNLVGLRGVSLKAAKAILRPQEVPEGLTPRQRRAMELRAKGLSNAEIAREMGVSYLTAKNHIYAAMRRCR